MCFDHLMKYAEKGELTCVDGGMCRWHLRDDNILTIYEIISVKPGAGTTILELLKKNPKADAILARCPTYYPSNEWWKKKGFKCRGTEPIGKKGKAVNVWVMDLQQTHLMCH
jgi:hypothetical protein